MTLHCFTFTALYTHKYTGALHAMFRTWWRAQFPSFSWEAVIRRHKAGLNVVVNMFYNKQVRESFITLIII
jgi:hypothetical protein